jgi:hypothetical protein
MPDVDQELNDRYQAKIDAGLVGNSGDVAEKRTSEREKRRQERWQAYRYLLNSNQDNVVQDGPKAPEAESVRFTAPANATKQEEKKEENKNE